MIEARLTIQDFERFFEQNKLGTLNLPNGLSWNPRTWEREGFDVNLRDLFKVMSGWKINSYEVPLDDIIAVIAYGSAVRHPGFEMVPETRTRRKYWGLFGPKIESTHYHRKDILPKDVDFFVLTESDITRHLYINPEMGYFDYGSGGCITAVTKGGIIMALAEKFYVLKNMWGKKHM